MSNFNKDAIEKGFPAHIGRDGKAYYSDGTIIDPTPSPCRECGLLYKHSMTCKFGNGQYNSAPVQDSERSSTTAVQAAAREIVTSITGTQFDWAKISIQYPDPELDAKGVGVMGEVAAIITKHLPAGDVESALAKLREMFPGAQLIVSIRDCGEETTTLRGTSLEYGVQVGMNGEEFDADTLDEAMAAVKQWKAGEFGEPKP